MSNNDNNLGARPKTNHSRASSKEKSVTTNTTSTTTSDKSDKMTKSYSENRKESTSSGVNLNQNSMSAPGSSVGSTQQQQGIFWLDANFDRFLCLYDFHKRL